MSTKRCAAALSICLAVAPSWAQQIGQQTGATKPAADSQGKPSAGAQSVPASPEVLKPLERIASSQETQAAATKPDDEKQRERDDLKAQQDMAYWARLLFFATLGSIAFTFASVVLLIKTLNETARSARAAVKAAAAARLANRISRRNAEQTLRAYLNVFEVQADWKMDEGFGQHRVSISIQVKNTGSTPARKVLSWMGYVSSKKEPADFGEIEANSPAVVGPNQSFWMAEEITTLGDDKVIEWQRGRETLYVWGKITYVDVFDQPRETWFRYFMPLAGIGDDHGRFRPCEDGNDYK